MHQLQRTRGPSVSPGLPVLANRLRASTVNGLIRLGMDLRPDIGGDVPTRLLPSPSRRSPGSSHGLSHSWQLAGVPRLRPRPEVRGEPDAIPRRDIDVSVDPAIQATPLISQDNLPDPAQVLDALSQMGPKA